MRRFLSLLVCAVVAGCGGGGAPGSPPAPRRPQRASREPTLVSFQRNGGLAATLDALVVRADATARLDKRYGGAGRRSEDFSLRPQTMRRLRVALERLPRRPAPVGAGTDKGATLLLTYRGRSLAAREGAVTGPGASAFELLEAIVDGSGRSP